MRTEESKMATRRQIAGALRSKGWPMKKIAGFMKVSKNSVRRMLLQRELECQSDELTQYALEAAGSANDTLLRIIDRLTIENEVLKRHQQERNLEIQTMMKDKLNRQMIAEEHQAKDESSFKD